MRNYGVPWRRSDREGKIKRYGYEPTPLCLVELYFWLCLWWKIHTGVCLWKYSQVVCHLRFTRLQCLCYCIWSNWYRKDSYNGRLQIQYWWSTERYNSKKYGRNIQIHLNVIKQKYHFYGPGQLFVDLQRNHLRSSQGRENFIIDQGR